MSEQTALARFPEFDSMFKEDSECLKFLQQIADGEFSAESVKEIDSIIAEIPESEEFGSGGQLKEMTAVMLEIKEIYREKILLLQKILQIIHSINGI